MSASSRQGVRDERTDDRSEGLYGGRPVPLPTAILHLAALWAFAVVQPVLDLLGRTPEFFVARGNTGGDIVALALALAIVPPVVLALMEAAIATISWRLAGALHLALVAALAALVALPLVGDLVGSAPAFDIALAAAAGVLIAALYARVPVARSLATALAVAPVLFVGTFLAFSPASKVILASEPSESVAGADKAVPIVVIVFDELPTTTLINGSGRLDARFPAFRRLAQDATWYRNATTVAEGTTEAVPALLTGSMPDYDKLPSLSDQPRNLFTMLAASHDIHAVESFTTLCPSSLCDARRESTTSRLGSLVSDIQVVTLHQVLPESLASGLPAINRTWSDFGDAPGPNAATPEDEIAMFARHDGKASFESFLDGIARPKGRPPLHFVHTSLPHAPWTMLPTGQHYPGTESEIPGLGDNEVWLDAPDAVEQSYGRHVLQAAYADRLLGRALDRLEEVELYDDALVVVVADHGVAFDPGSGRRAATRRTLPEIAGVPLLIKRPGQEHGRVDDRPARTIDVLPTIAADVEAAGSWRFDGSALDRARVASRDSVWIARRDDEHIRMPFHSFARERDEIARIRKQALRSSASPAERLYLAGPRADLLGRRLESFRLIDAPSSTTVEPEGAWASVDPTAGLLPAMVMGSAPGLSDGAPVVVAVDGTIVATGAVNRAPGYDDPRFSVLVPWVSLHRGRNSVVVATPDVDDVLTVVARSGTGRPYRVADDGTLIDPQGRRLPDRADSVTGYIDQAVPRGGVMRLSGWAATADLTRPARRVVATVSGKVIESRAPRVERADLAKGYEKPQLKRAGFWLMVPISELDCDAPDQGLSVVAAAGGASGALERVGDVDQRLSYACRSTR